MDRAKSIDWKRAFEKLKPFIQGKDGLVCISGGKDSAWRKFIHLVKKRIMAANSGGCNFFVSSAYDNIQCPEDMILKFASRINCPDFQPGAVNCFNQITAGGDLNITRVNIINKSDNFRSLEREPFLEKIIDHLKNGTDSGRFVMVLDHCHELPTDTAHWFWDHCWTKIAGALGSDFLTICACERQGKGCIHNDFASFPDKRILLPDRYENEDFEIALEDMAREISNITKNDHDARVSAETLLRCWDAIPSNVISGFSTYLLSLLDENQR